MSILVTDRILPLHSDRPIIRRRSHSFEINASFSPSSWSIQDPVTERPSEPHSFLSSVDRLRAESSNSRLGTSPSFSYVPRSDVVPIEKRHYRSPSGLFTSSIELQRQDRAPYDPSSTSLVSELYSYTIPTSTSDVLSSARLEKLPRSSPASSAHSINQSAPKVNLLVNDSYSLPGNENNVSVSHNSISPLRNTSSELQQEFSQCSVIVHPPRQRRWRLPTGTTDDDLDEDDEDGLSAIEFDDSSNKALLPLSTGNNSTNLSTQRQNSFNENICQRSVRTVLKRKCLDRRQLGCAVRCEPSSSTGAVRRHRNEERESPWIYSLSPSHYYNACTRDSSRPYNLRKEGSIAEGYLRFPSRPQPQFSRPAPRHEGHPSDTTVILKQINEASVYLRAAKRGPSGFFRQHASSAKRELSPASSEPVTPLPSATATNSNKCFITYMDRADQSPGSSWNPILNVTPDKPLTAPEEPGSPRRSVWVLPTSSSNNQRNVDDSNDDFPDSRIRRLFQLHLWMLFIFVLAVAGGLVVHRSKVVRISHSLLVEPRLFTMYHSVHHPSANLVQSTFGIRPTLGNLIAVDVLEVLKEECDRLRRKEQNSSLNANEDDWQICDIATHHLVRTLCKTGEDCVVLDGPWVNHLYGPRTLFPSVDFRIHIQAFLTWMTLSKSDVCFPAQAESHTLYRLICDISLEELQNVVNDLFYTHPVTRSLLPTGQSESDGDLKDVYLFSFGKAWPTGLTDPSIGLATSSRGPILHYPEHHVAFHEKSSQLKTLESLVLDFIKDRFFWDVHVSPLGSMAKQRQAVATLEESRELVSVVNLFNWSLGFLSPCYPFHEILRYLLSGVVVYLLLLICWGHSFFSPQPITLVHFPRVALLYSVIVGYRIAILYVIGGLLEAVLPTYAGDFSDNIVHYLALGLILSIEVLAAECSHPCPKVGTTSNSNGSSKSSRWWWQQSQTDTTETRPTSTEQKGSRRQTKCPVYFVYIYASLFWLSVSYSGFYTAAFFHTRTEVVIGCLVGIIGLYLPFWAILLSGCVQFDQMGILRDVSLVKRGTAATG